MYYISMAEYVERGLASKLTQFRGLQPILIIEGARAVGKTRMVRTQFVDRGDYHYVDLSDQDQLGRAKADVDGWLSRLPVPSVIDEAQLLPELPVALKRRVDDLGSGTHFVLTGSASIGRTGLGGADPLARRHLRMTLHPFTQWEISGQKRSLVDALFEAEPVSGTYVQLGDAQLVDVLRRGGFPKYVLPQAVYTRGARRRSIATDIDAVLSDTVLPEIDFNLTKARETLDALLRAPGGIFNATSLGSRLELDRRTVDRYLDRLHRLFLVQWLPNIATSPRTQGSSRAKIHPVDTSFSMESLERAGIDVLERREYFGQLLESFVACEVISSAQWADVDTKQYYWFDSKAKSPEVDLVLRGEDGREVAVEVKASSRVTAKDLSGLRAFARARSMHRGFLIYRGDSIQQHDDNIWAIPVSALGDAGHFDFGDAPAVEDPDGTLETHVTVSSSGAGQKREPTVSSGDYDAAIFLSYVHKDDAALNGRILGFAHDLAETYSLLFGRDLQIFTDQTIRWGEDWRARLKQEIGTATFMLSAVTPRYLTSEACRAEVLEFAAAATRAGDPKLLLPLIWVDIARSTVTSEDPVRKKLLASQYIDVTSLRNLEPSDRAYTAKLEEIAERLKETVDARLEGADLNAGEPGVREEVDLLDVFQTIEDVRARFDTGLAELKRAFAGIGAAFAAEPLPTAPGSSTTATMATLDRLADRLERPGRDLQAATSVVSETWRTFDNQITALVEMVPRLPPEIVEPLRENLVGLDQALDFRQLDQMEQMITIMGMLSKRLRPPAQALQSTLRLIRGIQDSAEAWEKALA